MSYVELSNIKNRFLENVRGWHTRRKIIVIESDDWGSIRMPSREVYNKCLAAGYPVDKTEYERYDTLLSQADLTLLFELLSNHRDKNNNHPVITANCVVANPDFEKIRESNFENYYFELVTETFKNYPRHSGNFRIWKEGIDRGVFFPQFHAREHLNVSLFMKALQDGDTDVHFGFKNRMPGCIPHGPELKGNRYVEATKYSSPEDKIQKLEIFLEGLDIFENLFGFRSETFIPPNYMWSPDYNMGIKAMGVIAIQGSRKMFEPVGGGNEKVHLHFLGKRNELGQTYLIRNALFEPSLMKKLKIKDPVDRCLCDIFMAFNMKRPAIICSHRINYAGFIDEANRDNTLKMLDQMLFRALKKWPDIEFMTSSQLVEIIARGQK